MATTKKLKALGKVTVTTAGTRVQITSSDIRATSVTIQADAANTGDMYVGDSTVASNKALTLDARESVSLNGDTVAGNTEEFNLSEIYVDSSVNGESVHVFYLGRS